MDTLTYDDAFTDGMMAALEEFDDYSYDSDDGFYDLDSFIDDGYSDSYAGEGLYDLDDFTPDYNYNYYDDFDPEIDYYAEESLADYFNWRKEKKKDQKNTKYYLKKYTSIARSLTKELKAKCKDALRNAQSQAEKISIKRDFDNKIARVWEKCEELKSNIPNKLKEHDSAIKKTTY